MMSSDFSPEQKRYLEGFATGLNAARTARGKGSGSAASTEAVGPDAIHIQAQDLTVAAGGKQGHLYLFKRQRRFIME